MAESPISIDRQWFDLRAMPDNIDAAVTAWSNMGTSGETTAADLDTAANTAFGNWQGETRTAYQKHTANLNGACSSMKPASQAIATALGNIADALRAKQSELTDVEQSVRGAVACEVGENRLTFRPETPEETSRVTTALIAAGAIRSVLNETLSGECDTLTQAVDAWTDMSADWHGVATGGIEGAFPLPPEPSGSGAITLPDGTVVVNTGGHGDDDVRVSTGPDGEVIVSVNGQATEYPPGTPIVLRSGAGNDYVELGNGTETTVVSGDDTDSVSDQGQADGDNTLLTGHGDDRVAVLASGDNRVSTGGGDDEVSLGSREGVDVSVSGDNSVFTGEGRDRVSINGDGDNVVITQGHDDPLPQRGPDDPEFHDDVVIGGDGADHIYTGAGNDYVRGGDGRDVIVGGDHDDEIYGQGHGDHIYGDAGVDYVDAGHGADNVYGGDDTDILYGMDGNDNLHGNSGSDYLEGAKGDDTLAGGDGGDQLSGGRDDDRMYGHGGADVMYGGRGTDHAAGGDGNDHAHIQEGDTTSGTSSEHVEIVDHDVVQIDEDASEGFRDRIEADLDMLSASPTGQQGLEYLRDHRNGNWWSPAENELVVQEYDEENGTANAGETWSTDDNSRIDINPDFIVDGGQGSENRPPVATLYHEIAHINTHWDESHDSGDVPTGPDADPDPSSTEDEPISKAERQAVGLPTDGSPYNEDNPRANLDLDYELTENGLLDELGLPARTTYSR